MSDAPPESKLISLSVREFALPSPRRGSIDTHSGYGKAQEDGAEIHRQIQKQRASDHENYESERVVRHEFEREGYRFRVEGRMDGLFTGESPKIEEIKSTFNIHELKRVLDESAMDHPYVLQVLTYGHFYRIETGENAELELHLVSSRNRQSIEYPVAFDSSAIEAWMERRLAELVEEARAAERRTSRRRKAARNLVFPFASPRPGQIELIESIEKGMKDGQRMLFQAPTGLGKTVGVLYPTLKEAMERGQRVVYVTPKNSQHAVAEEAVSRLQDNGAKIRSLTITAKSKMCFKAEPVCNPKYCEYAKDYYEKLQSSELLESLAKKKRLTSRTFKKLGEEHQVCPFELQLDSAADADVVICDYNYVFSPRSAFGRLPRSSFAQEGQPNLLVDEAHNLPSRAMDFYSPALSSFVLDEIRADFGELSNRFAREGQELVDECLEVLIGCRPDGPLRPARVSLSLTPFQEADSKLKSFLSRYLESSVEIQPGDPVLRLSFYWGQFTEMLEAIANEDRDEFFTIFRPERGGTTIKIVCCDASEMLKERYDDYDQVVAFSATAKPFDFYARLSGLDPATLKTEEFKSPFDPSRRKLLIIPQVSTKYSERQRNASRIAEAIARIAALRPGNHLAFFPSFQFLEQVLAEFRAPEGFAVLRQEKRTTTADVESVLDLLREPGSRNILFAVQGGVFSEGVDYPGEMVIGAFVIGPPLPNFDVEREGMKEYYQAQMGSGFDYAYTYPAMAKAIQSAGRVIRTETDRGVIVLMDSRFLEKSYASTFPSDWFRESPRELVSGRILSEITEFWAHN